MYYLQWLFSTFTGPSLFAMRTLNVFLFSNLFAVFVMKIFEFRDANPNNISRTINIALTPTIYFFHFMDYTDSASLALIAMIYYYNLVESEFRLSICSLGAVFIRQNNLIWIVFMMVYRAINQYNKQMKAPLPFIQRCINAIQVLFRNKFLIIAQEKFQILIIVIFYSYIHYFNEGQLVFGDHSHHKMKFHPTQLLYLSLFLVLNMPFNLDELISAFKNIFRKIYYSKHSLSAYLFLLSISIILVDKFTLVHDFTLADNRHYIFYLYRKIYQYSFWRFGMCLVYPICWIFLFKSIVKSE